MTISTNHNTLFHHSTTLDGIIDNLITSKFSFFFVRYVCIQGAFQSQPLDDATGRKCPSGFYCPAGTSRMHSCPLGTFNSLKGLIYVFMKHMFFSLYSSCSPIKNIVFLSRIRHVNIYVLTGAASILECQPCPPGQYCADYGLSSPSGPCNSGYYCTIRSVSPTPHHNRSQGK